MAKRVIWTESARIGRRLILEYWLKRTGNIEYSKKLAQEFNDRVDYLKKFPEIGKESDYPTVRTTACGHFSIFYSITVDAIVIIGIYDTRRDPSEIAKEIKKLLP